MLLYTGRRCSDDARQVSRGLGVIGPKGRWRNNLINKIINSCSGEGDLNAGLKDYSISPVVRQVSILVLYIYDIFVLYCIVYICE